MKSNYIIHYIVFNIFQRLDISLLIIYPYSLHECRDNKIISEFHLCFLDGETEKNIKSKKILQTNYSLLTSGILYSLIS